MVGCIYVLVGNVLSETYVCWNFTGLCKPKVWEHCYISWGGTKSPKSKAYESSLAFPPSSSRHPRHIQTLSKSCQLNLLNISGICTLLSVLAANSLGQALFIFLQEQSPYWSSCHYSPLIHAHQSELFKNQKCVLIAHKIKVSDGIQGLSPVRFFVVPCSHFLLVLSDFLCHLLG